MDGQEGLAAPDVEPVVIEAPCITCPQGPSGTPGAPGEPGPVGSKGMSGASALSGILFISHNGEEYGDCKLVFQEETVCQETWVKRGLLAIRVLKAGQAAGVRLVPIP